MLARRGACAVLHMRGQRKSAHLHLFTPLAESTLTACMCRWVRGSWAHRCNRTDYDSLLTTFQPGTTQSSRCDAANSTVNAIQHLKALTNSNAAMACRCSPSQLKTALSAASLPALPSAGRCSASASHRWRPCPPDRSCCVSARPPALWHPPHPVRPQPRCRP